MYKISEYLKLDAKLLFTLKINFSIIFEEVRNKFWKLKVS